MTTIPRTQHAVQLKGVDLLELNTSKGIPKLGPNEILVEVEAVGLCFSDLKLLARFDQHPRKGPVASGLDSQILRKINGYVPGNVPTVPGHEVACRVVAIGSEVKHHRIGERCLVQTDYRDLKTSGSNAAFGYNFEGGLQQYVVLDERVTMAEDGMRYLIPVSEDLSSSAVALVEPWACVEDSYVTQDRRTPKGGGRLLVVANRDGDLPAFDEVVATAQPGVVVRVTEAEVGGVPEASCDDIIYYGCSADIVELLDARLAPGGLLNVVLDGARLGRRVNLDVGRIHYGGTRWVGTMSSSPAEGYARIPSSGELRDDDRLLVIGAGGPMGQMHVLRAAASGIPNLQVVATDFDDGRLDALRAMLGSSEVPVDVLNAKEAAPPGPFSYVVLMVPVASLVQQAIEQAAQGAIINVFAGIPAGTKQEIDLDTYIERGCYAIGTSGSVVDDMRIVLDKLASGRLDTNRSVVAVAGMQGAIDGVRAVQKRTAPGKIVVYPQLAHLALTPLQELCERFPTIATKMPDGRWNREAERELLRIAADPKPLPATQSA